MTTILHVDRLPTPSCDRFIWGEGFAPEPFIYAVRRPEHHPVAQLLLLEAFENRETTWDQETLQVSKNQQ